MLVSLILLALWVLAANLAPLAPECRRKAAELALIVTGIGVLGFLTAHAGPVAGLAALVIGTAMLRWPLGRRLRAVLHR